MVSSRKEVNRRFYEKNKAAILQRRRDRRAARRAQLFQSGEEWRESSDPEVRSGYRPPDYAGNPDYAASREATKHTCERELLNASKVLVKAAKTRSPEMLAVYNAEMRCIQKKHGLKVKV